MTMDILKLIANGAGLAILWFIGMFALPMLAMLLYGFITGFDDMEFAGIAFFVTFVLYWIASGVILILL